MFYWRPIEQVIYLTKVSGESSVKISDRDFSVGKILWLERRFTDKEITAWVGMTLMNQMPDHLEFDAALASCGLL